MADDHRPNPYFATPDEMAAWLNDGAVAPRSLTLAEFVSCCLGRALRPHERAICDMFDGGAQ